MLTIGIDFGTTNCSAAVFRDGDVELIPLEGENTILPSTICITKDHEIYVGREAVEQYLVLTRDLPIRYKFTDLRELASVYENELDDPIMESSSDFVVVSNAGEDHDLDMPARLFQSLKTGLRDPSFNGSTIYDHYYAIEELIAIILRHIRECAETYLGKPVRAAVIGRPVSYAPSDGPSSRAPEWVNRIASERMLAAARIAGFTHAALEYEPVGAARHLRTTLPPESLALVFDFGGGTLDLAMARTRADQAPDILATHGVLLGGDDFDSAIMRHSLLKHFGQGTTLGPKQLPFPPNLLAPLLHWQTIPLLITPANAAHMAAIKRQSNAPHTVENLQTLVRKGLGFRLFQLIEAGKIRLSSERTARVLLRDNGLVIDEELTRPAFVEAISDQLIQVERGIDVILSRADLAPHQIDMVLMTGGSSLVPVVQGVTRRRFGNNRVRVADPFTSISAGLGIIAAQDSLCRPIEGMVASATAARVQAEAVTIGERVAFQRGHQTVEGIVVRRAGGRMHDATLVIEFWDSEIEEFVSTMRHETKVQRLTPTR